jgi:hypothetical protein
MRFGTAGTATAAAASLLFGCTRPDAINTREVSERSTAEWISLQESGLLGPGASLSIRQISEQQRVGAPEECTIPTNFRGCPYSIGTDTAAPIIASGDA